jgi:hypothetical protein
MGWNFNPNPRDAKRIGKAVRFTERHNPPSTGKDSAPTRKTIPAFWVKLGDEDGDHPGHYKWVAQTISGGAFSPSSTMTSGDDYTAHEVNTLGGLKNRYAQILFVGYDSVPKPVYLFSIQNGCFPVTLTSDGGDSGESGGGSASWTYTVKSEDGSTTYGTGISPEAQRIWAGAMNAATKGLAWFNGSSIQLRWCDEQIILGVACDPDCS